MRQYTSQERGKQTNARSVSSWINTLNEMYHNKYFMCPYNIVLAENVPLHSGIKLCKASFEMTLFQQAMNHYKYTLALYSPLTAIPH